MPNEPTPSEVQAALRRVRKFYDLGCKSLGRVPGRMEYGRMRDEASHFGLSEELLRKARQFADPQGYTPKELNAVLSQCRKAGFALGTTHVIRWLTIPKRRRARIERLTITERWNLSRLEAEIALEFGSRKAGGRRRRIPADSLGVLIQLESLCDGWRRWRESLVREPDDADKQSVDRDLPSSVRRRLSVVTKDVAELQVLVAAEIQRRKPNRSSRLVAMY
jgi:hypothetical protein